MEWRLCTSSICPGKTKWTSMLQHLRYDGISLSNISYITPKKNIQAKNTRPIILCNLTLWGFCCWSLICWKPSWFLFVMKAEMDFVPGGISISAAGIVRFWRPNPWNMITCPTRKYVCNPTKGSLRSSINSSTLQLLQVKMNCKFTFWGGVWFEANDLWILVR